MQKVVRSIRHIILQQIKNNILGRIISASAKNKGQANSPVLECFLAERCLESFCSVGLFPCHTEVLASHVTVCSKLSVLWLSEVKHFDDSCRTEVEYICNSVCKLLLVFHNQDFMLQCDFLSFPVSGLPKFIVPVLLPLPTPM